MRKKLALNWASVVGWMAVIFYFSSLPSSSLPSGVPDYVPHFIEYAILAFFLLRALKEHRFSKTAIVGLTALIPILYAASDEFHQSFVATRTSSLSDFLVDSLAAIAMAIYGNMRLNI